MDDFWKDAEVIHSYTRAQAIADGNLVEVGELAREAGFRLPLVLSKAAWADAVAWDGLNGADQDETGRLWDVLMMAMWAIQMRPRVAGGGLDDRATFEVMRVENTPGADTPRPVELIVHIGPGDDAAPVLTIMRPMDD